MVPPGDSSSPDAGARRRSDAVPLDVERVALDLQGVGLAQLLEEAGRRENGGKMEETLGKSGKNRWEHGGKLMDK